MVLVSGSMGVDPQGIAVTTGIAIRPQLVSAWAAGAAMLTAPQVRPAATVAATNLVTSLPMVFSTLVFGGIQTTVPVAVCPV